MALPTSGQISLLQVRTELGLSGQISLASGAVRSLAGVASGQIRLTDLRGKSSRPTATVTRGINNNNDAKGYYSGAYGAMTLTSFSGRTVVGVSARSNDTNGLFVNVSGTTSPGWTRIFYNGAQYNLGTWTTDSKTGALFARATISNIWNNMPATFTFSIE